MFRASQTDETSSCPSGEDPNALFGVNSGRTRWIVTSLTVFGYISPPFVDS
jgi:hypothetical protein